MRGETQVSPQVLLSLPQLVDGQCQISLSKAEVQGALEKLTIDLTDLPGLRLYVAAAIIESPGEWLPDCNPRLSPLTSELTLYSPAMTPLPSLLTLIWDPKPEKTQKMISLQPRSWVVSGEAVPSPCLSVHSSICPADTLGTICVLGPVSASGNREMNGRWPVP